MAEKNGWTYDASTQILSPKMRSNALDQIGPFSSEFSTLVLSFRIIHLAQGFSSFHFLADSVSRLEL